MLPSSFAFLLLQFDLLESINPERMQCYFARPAQRKEKEGELEVEEDVTKSSKQTDTPEQTFHTL